MYRWFGLFWFCLVSTHACTYTCRFATQMHARLNLQPPTFWSVVLSSRPSSARLAEEVKKTSVFHTQTHEPQTYFPNEHIKRFFLATFFYANPIICSLLVCEKQWEVTSKLSKLPSLIKTSVWYFFLISESVDFCILSSLFMLNYHTNSTTIIFKLLFLEQQ